MRLLADQAYKHFGKRRGYLCEVDGLKAISVRLEGRISLREKWPKDFDVILRSYFVGKLREIWREEQAKILARSKGTWKSKLAIMPKEYKLKLNGLGMLKLRGMVG